ncbi:MAG: hypothetical protein LBN05_04980 [Oscillospiraceae bacterium]|jgi:hypothetical protein|nr:hypothetical protein [Oscillospiraceae bacterium]
MRDIEAKIRNINGSMAIEGMPLTEEDKTRLRDLLMGKSSYDTVVEQLVQKHRKVPTA